MIRSDDRAETLKALAQDTLDLLVIGGGIDGAGVARDAAMRGLPVGLAEQYDLAFGTSSRSSRLLHGGLRYLAQGRLGLVREASNEKKILHRIAPHLAEPLAFIFPAYNGTRWPLWQLRLGVKMYDLLCSGKNLGKSGALTRDEVLNRVPELDPDGLTGAVRYFDALTNDARLVIDTLRSAKKKGAVILNYLQFKSAVRDSGVWMCELEEKLQPRKYIVRARAILNASGPWTEQLMQSRVKLRLTKGIHIVFERRYLPIPEAVALAEGNRLLFLIPWGKRVIAGTTDTDYTGSLDDVRATADEIDYLLQAIKEYFPSVRLSRADILSTFAGLRPLISRNNRAPSAIPRAHQLRTPEPGWWDLAGGKLTTYRLMAEQAVDQIIKWLAGSKKLNGKWERCRTAEEQLLEAAESDGISGILPPKFDREVVKHYCLEEWAVHLEDVMLRRSGWHYYFRDAREKAEQVADWMTELLEWTAETRMAELELYKRSNVEIQVARPP